MNRICVVVVSMVFFFASAKMFSQGNKELKYFLSKDSTQFVKLTFANQVWVRFTENNPGSTIQGEEVPTSFDIGLRRTRMQLYGKTSKHTFFYLQMGMNNFNSISSRKQGFFIHDALGEININRNIGFGAGLTAWTGFSRYSSPSVASIMALDAPLFLQATNDANDQFLRKLSVYAKGKLNRLDYRLVLSQPFLITTSTVFNPSAQIGEDARFSPLPPKTQMSGYLSWQFLEEESNELPYQVGTYLGNRSVFNIGAGAQFQQDAMWYKNGHDTLSHDMFLSAVDVYLDRPLRAGRGDAVSFYAVAAFFDFGKYYLRNQGPMNVTTGTNASGTYNGTGVAWPMVGSGMTYYIQLGYLTPSLSSTKSLGKLMPYLSAQVSQYDRVSNTVWYSDAGISWYLDGGRSKLTFGVQTRPVLRDQDPSVNSISQSSTRNSFILQFQVSI